MDNALSKMVVGLLLLPLLAGCWSRIEINDRQLAVGVYVDSAPNGEVELTLGYAKPNEISSQAGSGGADAKAYTTISASGTTISDAYRKIQMNSSREVLWGQIKVVVIGKDYAAKGIGPLLDFLNRKPGIPLKTYMMMAEGKAKDLSNFTTQIEKFPSEILRELIARRKTIASSIKHFLIAKEYGRGMVMAMIGDSESKEDGVRVQVKGAAMFQDNKMVGTMNEYDMRGAMWLRGNMQDAIITFPVEGEGGPMASILVTNIKSGLKPALKDDRYVLQQKLEVVCIVDSVESYVDLENHPVVEQLESRVAEEVKERIEGAFEKSKKSKADIFQLGAYLSWYFPETWDRIKADWSELYGTKADVELEIDADVRYLGAVKDSRGLAP